MSKITEIVPDDLPDWAREAFDDGQFFRVAVEKVRVLQIDNERLQAQYDDMFSRVVAVSGKMEAQLNKTVPVDALGWPKQ